MTTSILLIVFFFLIAALMAALVWIGWKYFYAPDSSRQPKPEPVPRIQPKAPTLEPRVRWERPAWTFQPSRLLAPFKSKQAMWLLVPILVVGMVVGITLTLSRDRTIPPLTPDDLPTGTYRPEFVILDPPQPLPSEMFVGTEDPFLSEANREWKRMNADFVQVVLNVFRIMEQRGYRMALLEGYRSPDRQEFLARQGTHVTRAGAYQSKHQYGMAADVAFIRDGRLVISEKDPWAAAAYQVLGEVATQYGLIWGGRWEKLRDLGHIESPKTLKELQNGASLPKPLP